MKYIGVILLAWFSINNNAGQGLYICKNARISLYSNAPIEDIKAVTTAGASVYNSASNKLDFSVSIRSFQFEKAVMQEHFNSDYMESDKFPRATFKGRVKGHIDADKDGIYPVSVTGELTIHGITQARTIPGSIILKNGVITMTSEFIVKCSDFHIDIPQVVFHHIAESIKMNVSATFSAYK